MKVTNEVQRTKIKTVSGEIKTINYQLNPLNNNTMFWFDGSPTMYHGKVILNEILKKCKYE
jgi:hypothetical protein